MSPSHRRFLINELMRGIETIGPEFEQFGTLLVEYLVGEKMLHRGLNPHGHPVGHAVDSVNQTGSIATEYSAEEAYFKSPFTKIRKDLKHARTEHPQVLRIVLLSSRACGPKAHTRLVNFSAHVKRCLNIDVDLYDSRRQAEFIVDHLLLNETAVDALAAFLSPLNKVRSEFVATNMTPVLDSRYLSREDVEKALKDAVLQDRVGVLSGISGAGKSETAVAVANAVAKRFELSIWISANEVTSLNDLQALSVERCEQRLNVLHLLRDRSCLLILDDLHLPIAAQALKQYCGEASSIVVTRQVAVEGDLRMPMLGRDDARKLLEQGTSTCCPDDVFDVVWETVGGHPLALRLMNTGVRNGSWDDLREDCSAIGQYQDKDRPQRLAERLLGRLKQRLEKELSFFAWCLSPRVDRTFARRVLRPVGLRNLDEACVLAADRNDVVRLHDVIKSSMQSIKLPVGKYGEEFNAAMDAQVEELACGDGTALGFMNFCDVHGMQMERLLRENPKRSTCLYCLAHMWSTETADMSLIGDPVVRAQEAMASGGLTDIAVSAICEAIEVLYRKKKQDAGVDSARTQLDKCLQVYVILATAPKVSPNGRRVARHHHAKALRNLRRFEEAIQLCEIILAEAPSEATKLLLARVLIQKRDRSGFERAKNLLFDILEAAAASPAEADISVILAAIETLGWWQLKVWQRDALDRFGKLASDYICECAIRGFHQAFVAFASIGRELRYHDPNLFVATFSRLPKMTPEDVREDQERAAWGNILLAASEVPGISKPGVLAQEAVAFLDALEKPDTFMKQQLGHALVALKQFERAISVLQPVVEEAPNPWNRYWLSKALLGVGNAPAALKMIDDALVDEKAGDYRPAMLEHRWEVRKVCGDPKANEDLQRAHEIAKDAKHKAALADKIAIEMVARPPENSLPNQNTKPK